MKNNPPKIFVIEIIIESNAAQFVDYSNYVNINELQIMLYSEPENTHDFFEI